MPSLRQPQNPSELTPRQEDFGVPTPSSGSSPGSGNFNLTGRNGEVIEGQRLPAPISEGPLLKPLGPALTGGPVTVTLLPYQDKVSHPWTLPGLTPPRPPIWNTPRVIPGAPKRQTPGSQNPPPPSITPPKNPGSPVTPPPTHGIQPSTEISIDKLRNVNEGVEIRDKNHFILTNDLKYMFPIPEVAEKDSESNALLTKKPIDLGNGIRLPPGTKITNSDDDIPPGMGKASHDPGAVDYLKFTTPNGDSFKFTYSKDKKTRFPTTTMEFGNEKSQEKKSVTFFGAPIYNVKSNTLTVAIHIPTAATRLFDDLLDRVISAADQKREGWTQADKEEVQKFFTGLK